MHYASSDRSVQKEKPDTINISCLTPRRSAHEFPPNRQRQQRALNRTENSFEKHNGLRCGSRWFWFGFLQRHYTGTVGEGTREWLERNALLIPLRIFYIGLACKPRFPSHESDLRVQQAEEHQNADENQQRLKRSLAIPARQPIPPIQSSQIIIAPFFETFSIQRHASKVRSAAVAAVIFAIRGQSLTSYGQQTVRRREVFAFENFEFCFGLFSVVPVNIGEVEFARIDINEPVRM